jgi:outer membrane protein insertion porin family
VQGIPEINEEENKVSLKFFIDPGKRTYVRRINFSGNTRTADEVLRREMRQMEAAPASAAAIEQSKVRLERLGYFKQAVVETTEVPGSDDLIDLEYIVEEQNTGSIGASIGYSQDSGVLLGANLEQNNFLGTGKNIGVGLSKSDYLSSANFSYVDPYYTKDGVSRGFSVFYREMDLDEINVSSYNTNTLGASVNFSYPIKETERLGFSFGYTNTEIETGVNAVQEIIAGPRLADAVSYNGVDYNASYYVDLGTDDNGTADDTSDDYTIPVTVQELYDSNGNIVDEALDYLIDTGEDGFIDKNGDTFNNFSATISWNQSTLNRGILATRGYSQSLSFEATVPGSDLQYFKLIYRGERFFPLTRQLTLRLRGEFGYGDGYGDTDGLPFFNNFYAGGFGSVRGYKSNTLGPRSTPAILYSTASPLVGYVEVGGDDCFSDVDDDGVCDGSGEVVGTAIYDDDYAASYYVDSDTGLFSAYTYGYDPDPFGGNVLIESSAEVIFPLPFIEDQRSLRSVFFIDAGNVFNSSCGSTQLNCFKPDFNELRYSYGIGISWITGFGPLSFSYAKPINETETDEVESFQFTMGRTF